MKTRSVDIAVIGAGPAGLAAALAASEEGAEVLLLERNQNLGGILNQCIHDGFGVEILEESLTGPEYAQVYIDRIKEKGVEAWTNAMVLNLSRDKQLIVSTRQGLYKIQATAVVLAMGCRERTRGNIAIPGSRPSGVYTAGCAQNLINLKNHMVGREVVILGSGDIGLIMARRLTLEGANVHAVAEIMPYTSGLPRNVRQCLKDYDIPLYLRHTVTDIKGLDRVESVTLSEVDENWDPICGTEKEIECDTLLLSVGLIPENELSEQAEIEISSTGGPVVDEDLETNVEGIFACGNVLQVHDLVDWVSLEAEKAGKKAAEYVQGRKKHEQEIETSAGHGVMYVLPHRISGENRVELSLRVLEPGRDKRIIVKNKKREILKEIREPRVNPAEMIRISLEKEDLVCEKELEVSLGE